MPTLPIRMPQLGESAADAIVRTWLVAPGDPVVRDQDILEVETEKSILTVTAPAKGILLTQAIPPDTEVAVGEVLGELDVDGEEAGRTQQQAEGQRERTATHSAARPETADDRRPHREAEAEKLPVPARTGGLGYLSPRLRARMSEWGLRQVDISGIKGTGQAGRVSVRDLEHYLEQVEERQQTQASPMRIAVADSMRRSWSRPIATVALDVDLSALMEHRRGLRGRPSATIYGLKALALALARNDHLACRLVGDRLIHPDAIDLAFAVEIEDGVRTPVIQNVPALDMERLTEVYNEIYEKARDPRRSAEVLNQPSIASVSNFGTFGIRWATPIPLPDHSLVLGIGCVRKVPDWLPAEKTWGMTRVCEMSVTFDHRVADGGAAGRLLKTIRDLLEHPEKLG